MLTDLEYRQIEEALGSFSGFNSGEDKFISYARVMRFLSKFTSEGTMTPRDSEVAGEVEEVPEGEGSRG